MKTYSKKGIILLCSLAYFTSYFARKDFAAVSAGILESGFFDKEFAGLIGTAMFAMYGIGQVTSGLLGWKENIIAWGMIALLGVICTVLSYKKYTAFCKEDE